ncbi:IncA protein [Chlamydia serpentis]|uniref:IncA protein n=1 Tax=Chlamydia serpentis TaxID=1967782 RepID=A0A2R8FBA9_9CHLA|nr:IncA family protein [Chlamydia serpentis]SPN73705.1 IncA protein [Chlamydia serpentis]
MSGIAQNNNVVQIPGLARGEGNLIALSPLTPQERGELVAPIEQGWHHTIVKVSLVVLSLLVIVGGALLLTLLPGVPLFIGASAIALGGVLLILVLFLFLIESGVCPKRREAEPLDFPPLKDKASEISELQAEMSRVLQESSLCDFLKNKNSNDPEVLAQVLEAFKDCQACLAVFERKLRCKEEQFHRSFAIIAAQDPQGKYELLIELLEIRSRVADQLEKNSRDYYTFISGTFVCPPEGEKEIVRLQNKIRFAEQIWGDLERKLDEKQNQIKGHCLRITQFLSNIREGHKREASIKLDEGRELSYEERTHLEGLFKQQNQMLNTCFSELKNFYKLQKDYRQAGTNLKALKKQLLSTEFTFLGSNLLYRDFKVKYLEQHEHYKVLREQLNQLEARCNRLQGEAQFDQDADKKSAIAWIEERTRLNNELLDYQNAHRKQSKKISGLETMLLEYKENLQETERELEELQVKYARIVEEKITRELALTSSLDDMSKLYQASQTELATLQEQLLPKDEETLPSLDGEWVAVGEHTSQLKILVDANQALTLQINEKDAKIQKLLNEMKEDEKVLADLQSQIAEHKKTIVSLEKMNEQVYQDFAEVQRKYELILSPPTSPEKSKSRQEVILEMQLVQLQEENEQLRIQIARLEELLRAKEGDS